MGLLDPLKESVSFVKQLSPGELRKLGRARLSDIINGEIPRSRKRISELEQKYPSAKPRELAQRLIDEKKSSASMVGGLTGLFGLAGVPFDLVVVLYFEVSLLTDVATLYKANLKAESGRNEVLDLLGEAHGLSTLTRAAPRTLGSLAAILFARSRIWGRAIPGASAIVGAWMNNRHIQNVGDSAIRHYEGFDKAHKKTRETAG